MLEVELLGNGGTWILPNRFLTSLVLKFNGRLILIDAGEGTQLPLKNTGWKLKNIDYILLTHYHADHVAGLPGILLAIGNAGRTEPLTIMGPFGLTKVIEGITVITPYLPYQLKLQELNENNFSVEIMDNLNLNVIPAQHTQTCLSYCFEIKRMRKFYPEKAVELGISKSFWKVLQRGEKVVLGDKVIEPDLVLGPERKGLKVCYATDTRPTDKLKEGIFAADLFVGEGMYGTMEDSEKAEKYGHMTFTEAANLAREGKVAELWLTHFSPSLVHPEQYLRDAQDIFPNTFLGESGKRKVLLFSEK